MNKDFENSGHSFTEGGFFESEKIDYEECIGCSQKFDYELMKQDNADENYCQECYDVMMPIMKAEYDEMVKNGEIDETNY